MDIVTICALSLIIVAVVLSLKEVRPELTLLLSMAFGVILFLQLAEPISETVAAFSGIAAQAGLANDILSVVLKVIGVSFICEFAASLCNDAGETAIGSKVEMAGKIIILALAMPVLTDILDVILQIIT